VNITSHLESKVLISEDRTTVQNADHLHSSKSSSETVSLS